jgi:hypothetical protein
MWATADQRMHNEFTDRGGNGIDPAMRRRVRMFAGTARQKNRMPQGD